MGLILSLSLKLRQINYMQDGIVFTVQSSLRFKPWEPDSVRSIRLDTLTEEEYVAFLYGVSGSCNSVS